MGKMTVCSSVQNPSSRNRFTLSLSSVTQGRYLHFPLWLSHNSWSDSMLTVSQVVFCVVDKPGIISTWFSDTKQVVSSEESSRSGFDLILTDEVSEAERGI